MAAAAQRKGSPSLAILLVAAFALSVFDVSASETVSGAIKGYECGDNCYLTIERKGGDDLTGLCSAIECDPWNEEVAIPEDMIGRKVTVTVEMGQQTDAEGNVMGEFPSFTKIAFDK